MKCKWTKCTPFVGHSNQAHCERVSGCMRLLNGNRFNRFIVTLKLDAFVSLLCVFFLFMSAMQLNYDEKRQIRQTTWQSVSYIRSYSFFCGCTFFWCCYRTPSFCVQCCAHCETFNLWVYYVRAVPNLRYWQNVWSIQMADIFFSNMKTERKNKLHDAMHEIKLCHKMSVFFPSVSIEASISRIILS